MIRLSYVFDEETYLQAHRALWRRRRASARNRLFGLVWAAGLPVSAWLMMRYGMIFTFLAVVAGNLVYWIFDWPITRYVLRRQFANIPGANGRFSWEISDAGLRVRGAGDEGGLIPWSALKGLEEEEEGFLLLQDHNVTQWLPRSAFATAADVAAFRELAARHAPAGTDDEPGAGAPNRDASDA